MTYQHCVRALLLVLVMSCLPGAASAAPEVGWWWNPAESGRGFFIENKDGVIYLAGYFYENDGRAKWLVAGGPIADPYTYDGRLLAYNGGQTLYGDYVHPAAAVDVGAVSLRFSDDTHAVLTWPGGSIPIGREVFDTGAAPFQPINGWWWNDTESGRGYSVEVRGGSAFVVAFMYDDAGNPVWYFSAGPMSSPTTFEGPWLQFANGQTLTGSYHPPGVPTTVGQLSLQFNSDDDATATWTDAPASSGAKAFPKIRSKLINLKPEFPKPHTPPTIAVDHPDRLVGDFTQTQDVQGNVMEGVPWARSTARSSITATSSGRPTR